MSPPLDYQRCTRGEALRSIIKRMRSFSRRFVAYRPMTILNGSVGAQWYLGYLGLFAQTVTLF